MARAKNMRNILMELRKVCQHPYLSAPDLEKLDLPEEQQQKNLINGSGKLMFLKLLLPKLKERGHRVLLFSQFKIALDRIEDFLYGEGLKFLRLDGDVQQAQRQKSMDAFNAPDSDYFIFLLTTRAGGVGINLATADTVIIFDPDFNPHMDLQAIARSHRYGQKKKVLVFKLMTKDSVEEKIIWAGKKKMVLDHLVVQQMGKENEEGEIDNMLLHGAKALYDTDADGKSKFDVTYTSKNVDELIDKVEQEAEAEAKALAERDANIANGTIEANTTGAESMSFAFAKIWETDKGTVEEIQNDEENPENTASDWQEVMKNVEAEKARLRSYGQHGGVDLHGLPVKRSRKHVNGNYRIESGFSDESPSRKKFKSGKHKGSKFIDASDPDFTAPAQSESDEDSALSAVEDLGDLKNTDRQSPGGLVELAHGKKKAKLEAMRQQLAQENNVPLPNGSSQRGSTSTSKSGSPTKPNGHKNETPEERVAGKAAKRAAREALLAERQANAIRALEQRRALVARTEQTLNQNQPRQIAQPPRNAPRENQTEIDQGRAVVQWLYATLKETGLTQHLPTWATMALPELPITQRKGQYMFLAGVVDDQLVSRYQERYFTQPQQQELAFILIDSRLPVIPDDEGVQEPPPMPPNSISSGRLGHSRDTLYAAASAGPSAPPAGLLSTGPLPSTSRQATPPPNSPLTHQPIPLSSNINRPPSPGPSTIPDARLAPPASAAPAARPPSITPPDPINQLPSSPACEFCRRRHAGLCPTLAPLEQLYTFREAILMSNEPEEEKRQGLTVLDKMIAAHQRAAPQPLQNRDIHHREPSFPAPAGHFLDDTETIPIDHSGVRDHPIEDNDIGDQAAAIPTKAIVTPLTPRRSQGGSQPTSVKRRGVDRSCQICNSSFYHSANDCPIVKAGPESIALAMRRFPNKKDPMRQVLQQHYRSKLEALSAPPTPICTFCLEPCGLTVRHCVEGRGGRKQLKDRIRGLETLVQSGDTNKETQRILDALYDVYRQWPKGQAA